jgi:pimeloyl-ACP methyl ester carboxylesterase
MVAEYLATFIEYLQINGLSLDQTDIVGYSLGCHLAGLTGEKLNGQIKRIIGNI